MDYIKEAKTLNITTNQLHKWLKDPYPEFDKVLEFRQNTAAITHYPEALLRWATNDTIGFNNLIKFYNATRTELFPFRTELMMFDEYYKVAGSIDMLFKNANGEIVICDWKCVRIICQNDYKPHNRGFGELQHLPNCNFQHYSLQLNMYRHILETKYNESVAGMLLVNLTWCNRLTGCNQMYNQYQVEPMNAEIQTILGYQLHRLLKTHFVDNVLSHVLEAALHPIRIQHALSQADGNLDCVMDCFC